MSRTKQIVKLNSFIKGLITEANPIEFPSDASIDELNFTMDTDGTRRRRLGIDYEQGFSLNTTNLDNTEDAVVSTSSINWENVGEDATVNLIVVSVGNTLYFHDALSETISDNSGIPSISLDRFKNNSKLSLTTVDGFLIAVAGDYDIAIISYNGTSMDVTYKNILTRDTFGVADLYSGDDTEGEIIDLREGTNLQFRPKLKTDSHIYNLRNQSWGSQRRPNREASNSFDPIVHFHTGTYYTDDNFSGKVAVEGEHKNDPTDKGRLPSNSDIVHYGMSPDADDNPPADNLSIQPFISDPIGNIEAPRGYFIIDALKRGSSRLLEYKKLISREPLLEVDIDILPEDATPKGASQIASFAGRVFYAGFSGDVIDGDAYSPRLSSYVFFSRLVETVEDINKCYQEGDPTSEDYSDVVDTDGGFVKISGAYNIKKLVNLGDSLAIVAENGIWVLSGSGAGEGFSATGFKVSKISEYGAISDRAVIPMGGGLLYWGKDSIYSIDRDTTGTLTSNNITENTIQSFYNEIPLSEKESCKGFFDLFERRIHWLYGGDKILTLDTKRAAFIPSKFSHDSIEVTDIIEVPNFRIGVNIQDVTVGGSVVTVGTANVTVKEDLRISGNRSIKFLTMVKGSSTYSYTFSLFSNTSFLDWFSYDSIGKDANAYMVTGFLTGGDIQRNKSTNYVTTHFKQTESGLDSEGNLLNPSGCLMQGQWEWSSSSNSNRWNKEQQVYRLRRAFFSSDITFDNGFSTVITKNKLRGNGKAISLKFSTEPFKDCRLLGVSMKISVNDNV